MIEFYPQIKYVHVLMVLLSGALFALRGVGVLAGARWPQSLPLRWTSYAIDTTLLTAAMMLLTILPWAMFGNGWLGTKLVLLVVYVVLGSLALKRGCNARTRAWCFAAAALVYVAIIGIALAHHPLGWLHYWQG
ncbi:MAG: SirB2 family protein [Pseudoxanthomonas sp.]